MRVLQMILFLSAHNSFAAFTSRCIKTHGFHKSSRLNLNRFLFDPSEIISNTTTPYIILPKEDFRTLHASKILNLQNGDCLRAGVVKDAEITFHKNNTSTTVIKTDEVNQHLAGMITDMATIQWVPEGKIKKAEPSKNGDPPGSLQIILEGLSNIEKDHESDMIPHVSLILALPRPLALSRLLPMIAQMGVHDLVLTSAAKVPKDYFGSHLFRNPMQIRSALIEGLCQASDVIIPRVTVTKRLKPFLEDDLDRMFPVEEYCRVIAHPKRKDGPKALKLSKVQFPKSKKRKMVIAVGPEGGWSEPYELDMFTRLGFQQVTLGPRILRSDVAVISLLSQAQSVVSDDENES